MAWEQVARDEASLARWLDEWVYGVKDRAEYMERQPELMLRLKAKPRPSGTVDYGY